MVKNIERLSELQEAKVKTPQQDAELANLKGAVDVFIGTFGVQLLFGWIAYQQEHLPLVRAMFPVVGRIVGELSRNAKALEEEERKAEEDGATTTYDEIEAEAPEVDKVLSGEEAVPKFEPADPKDELHKDVQAAGAERQAELAKDLANGVPPGGEEAKS
jgi:hypothetical protein